MTARRGMLAMGPDHDLVDALRLEPGDAALDGIGFERMTASEARWVFDRVAHRDLDALRHFALELGLSRGELPRLDDDELSAFVLRQIDRGALVGIRWSSPRDDLDERGKELGQLVARVRALTSRVVRIEDREYFLVTDRELSRARASGDFEIVSRAEALRVVRVRINRPGSNQERAAWSSACDALTRDWRSPYQPDGLVLLRRKRAPVLLPRPSEPAVTPSSIFPRREREDWIEVVLLDEEGEPYANGLVELTLPGGEVRQEWTDEEGLVRVTGLAEGSCRVRLPNIDRHAPARA